MQYLAGERVHHNVWAGWAGDVAAIHGRDGLRQLATHHQLRGALVVNIPNLERTILTPQDNVGTAGLQRRRQRRPQCAVTSPVTALVPVDAVAAYRKIPSAHLR